MNYVKGVFRQDEDQQTEEIPWAKIYANSGFDPRTFPQINSSEVQATPKPPSGFKSPNSKATIREARDNEDFESFLKRPRSHSPSPFGAAVSPSNSLIVKEQQGSLGNFSRATVNFFSPPSKKGGSGVQNISTEVAKEQENNGDVDLIARYEQIQEQIKRREMNEFRMKQEKEKRRKINPNFSIFEGSRPTSADHSARASPLVSQIGVPEAPRSSSQVQSGASKRRSVFVDEKTLEESKNRPATSSRYVTMDSERLAQELERRVLQLREAEDRHARLLKAPQNVKRMLERSKTLKAMAEEVDDSFILQQESKLLKEDLLTLDRDITKFSSFIEKSAGDQRKTEVVIGIRTMQEKATGLRSRFFDDLTIREKMIKKSEVKMQQIKENDEREAEFEDYLINKMEMLLQDLHKKKEPSSFFSKVFLRDIFS